jgi:cell division protein ZapA
MSSDAERKTVRVTIFNQPYTLAATGEPGEIEELASSVDALMSSISSRAANLDTNRLAVLSCLHLADQLRTAERELAAVKARVDHKTRELSILLDQVID